MFFDGVDVETHCMEGKLSPKILNVMSEARLSCNTITDVPKSSRRSEEQSELSEVIMIQREI